MNLHKHNIVFGGNWRRIFTLIGGGTACPLGFTVKQEIDSFLVFSCSFRTSLLVPNKVQAQNVLDTYSVEVCVVSEQNLKQIDVEMCHSELEVSRRKEQAPQKIQTSDILEVI
jgi:hypothetical protein